MRNIKTKLLNGEYLIGTWMILPSPEVSNILIKSGLNFIIIDMEHGPVDFVTAQRMIMCSESAGGEAIVRLGDYNESSILKALDIGAHGIIVPHISNKSQAQEAISSMLYPPKGNRGYSPYTKAGGYFHNKGFTDSANESLLKGVIVEGKDGLKNLDSILEVEGIDLVYVGAYDISSSLGIPGQIEHPKVIKILKECVKKINRRNKIAGGLFKSKKDLHFFKKIGIRFLVYKVDTWVLYEEFKKISYKNLKESYK